MLFRIDDEVQVIAGADAPKKLRGRILKIDRKKNKVVVEGAAKVWKHVRRSQKNPAGWSFEQRDANRRQQRHAGRSQDGRTDENWRSLLARWKQGTLREEERCESWKDRAGPRSLRQ